MKLNAKLLIIQAGVALVLIPIVGYLTSRWVTTEAFDAIHESIRAQLKQIDVTVSGFLGEVEHDVRALSTDETVRMRADEEFTTFLDADETTFTYRIGEAEQRIISRFQNYKTNHAYANSVYMGRENGSFVRSHPRTRPTPYDPRERPWYHLAAAHPERVVRTQPYRSVTTPDVNIGTVKALVDDEGALYGVVGVDITLLGLTEYVSGLKVGENGYIFLLDSVHTVMTSGEREARFMEQARGSPCMARVVTQDEGYLACGENYLFHLHSPVLGWRICSVIPMEEIDSKVRRSVMQATLWVLLVLVTLSLLAALGVRRFIVSPTRRLQDSVESIMKTDDLGHRVAVGGRDEIGQLAGAFNKMLANLEQSFAHRMQLEKANVQLGRYFSPTVASKIASAEADFLKPGGQVQDVAILFADIRNFTPLSESLEPDQVMAFLSTYHAIMVDIIFRNHGTLDKFIGDGIMATFGTPEAGDEDVFNAVNAAMEMQGAADRVAESVSKFGLPRIDYGIGVHFGPAIVGNIGTEERLEYTVIGDTVNVASRIESACKDVNESLLISGAVYERVRSRVTARSVGKVALKGKVETITLYALDA